MRQGRHRQEGLRHVVALVLPRVVVDRRDDRVAHEHLEVGLLLRVGARDADAVLRVGQQDLLRDPRALEAVTGQVRDDDVGRKAVVTVRLLPLHPLDVRLAASLGDVDQQLLARLLLERSRQVLADDVLRVRRGVAKLAGLDGLAQLLLAERKDSMRAGGARGRTKLAWREKVRCPEKSGISHAPVGGSWPC